MKKSLSQTRRASLYYGGLEIGLNHLNQKQCPNSQLSAKIVTYNNKVRDKLCKFFDLFRDPIKTSHLRRKYLIQRQKEIFKYNILVLMVMILVMILKIFALYDENTLQEYYLATDQTKLAFENGKTNLIVSVSMIGIYALVILFSHYSLFASRYSYLLLVIISPLFMGVKPANRLDVVNTQLFFVFLIVGFGMVQCCEECVISIAAYLIHWFMIIFLYDQQKVIDMNGQPSQIMNSLYYKTFLYVQALATFTAFVICQIDVVQSRKKRFICQYQSNIMKASYEAVLGNFPEGILIATSDCDIQFMNDELYKFLMVDDTTTYENCLSNQLFAPYQLGNQKQVTNYANKSLEEIIQEFQYENKSKESTLILIKNITQLLKQEQSKNESKYQEMLTATLSHELMNPLNSVINLSGPIEKTRQVTDLFKIQLEQKNVNIIIIEKMGLPSYCDKCGYLVVQVEDTGIGIDEQKLSNLFQIFGNYKKSQNGVIGTSGIGLGLSMSKDLAQALKGDVQITSQCGKGTKVIFKIRVQQEDCIKIHPSSEQNRGNVFKQETPLQQQVSVKLQNEYKIQIIQEPTQKKIEGSSVRTSKNLSSSTDPLPNLPFAISINKNKASQKYRINRKPTDQIMVSNASQRRFFGGDVDLSSINLSNLGASNPYFQNLVRNENSLQSASGSKTNHAPTQEKLSRKQRQNNKKVIYNESKTSHKSLNNQKRSLKTKTKRFSMIDNVIQDSSRFSMIRANNSNANQFSNDFSRLHKLSGEQKPPIQKTSSKNGNVLSSLTSIEQQIQQMNISQGKKQMEVKDYQMSPNISQNQTQSNRTIKQITVGYLNPLQAQVESQRSPHLKLKYGPVNYIRRESDSFQTSKEYHLSSPQNYQKYKQSYNSQNMNGDDYRVSEVIVEEELKEMQRNDTKKNKRKTSKFLNEANSMMNIQYPINDVLYLHNSQQDYEMTGVIPVVSGNFNQDLLLEDDNELSDDNSSINTKQKQCTCTAQILIVDDNMFNLIPLEMILKEMFGLQVDKAFNGQEAVNMFNKNLQKTCCAMRYKLIFMDLNMPIMDGYDSTTQILAQFKRIYPNSKYPNGDQLNVVAITAFVNDENINQCYQVGMKDVLHKPVNTEALGKALDTFFHYKSKN
eukprot:403346138